MNQLCIADIQEAVADAVPQRDCIVTPSRKQSYAELNNHSRQLAGFLTASGLGCHTERDALPAWASGQDHVGLYMYNCPEYLEAEFACTKARTAAVNINYRYIEQELQYLFCDAGLKAVIFHSTFADRITALRPKVPELGLLIQLPDESGNRLLPGAVWYEDALASTPFEYQRRPSSPDDLHILYTGGTTGMPKGVLWRQADIIIAALGGRRPDGKENALSDFVHCAQKRVSRTLPAGPFMHASGRWSAMSQILLGNTVVLPANTQHMDADDIWSTIEREQVSGLNIAGDAFARPLLEALDCKHYDLGSLRAITSGAAVLSAAVKKGLLDRLPKIRIIDTIGASETGPQASSVAAANQPIQSPLFELSSSSTVLSDDLQSIVPIDSEETGWLARSGCVPLGYLGDADKTRKCFPAINGVRYAVPGDRACWRDGAIHLFGRDAMVINTGGEKVFAEEVEIAIKHHPSVFDAIVCGRPSERWGSEIVAIVKLRQDQHASMEDLRGECAKHLARYKLPKVFLFRNEIRRSASGKPDYFWARAEAAADQERQSVRI